MPVVVFGYFLLVSYLSLDDGWKLVEELNEIVNNVSEYIQPSLVIFEKVEIERSGDSQWRVYAARRPQFEMDFGSHALVVE